MIFIKGEKSFIRGQLNNIVINKKYNDTTILELKKIDNNYVKSGIYISEVFNVEFFNKLIVSWNAETPKDTSIKVEAKVFIVNSNSATKGKWSEWVSWGQWGTEIKRKSDDTRYNDVQINTDTVNIKNNKVANKLQLKVTFISENSKNTPILRQLIIDHINKKEKNISNYNYDEIIVNKIIDIPCISQMLRDKSICHRICSPTSLTMLLNGLGEKLVVEDVAWKCFDYKYDGFGNWVYNVAFAASLKYEAYVKFGSIEALKNEILKGYGVAVSVKYTNDLNNKSYPYVEGAPTTTEGHLIVVCGMQCNESNEKYVIVNDPAGKNDEEVRRKYKLNEFIEAWNTSDNIMYIIHS